MNTVERSFRIETAPDLFAQTRLRPEEPPVYAGFLGSIPPEETDEEFAAAIDMPGARTTAA